MGAQIRMITTITVVICIMRRALWLGLRDSFDVAVPEIDGDGDAEEDRESIGVGAPGLMQRLGHVVQEAAEVLAGADGADGAGQDVIDN